MIRSALMPMAISDSAVISKFRNLSIFFLLHVKFINCSVAAVIKMANN